MKYASDPKVTQNARLDCFAAKGQISTLYEYLLSRLGSNVSRDSIPMIHSASINAVLQQLPFSLQELEN